MSRLCQAGVSLLVTGTGLGAALSQRLLQGGVATVQRAGREEVQHLCRALPTVPWVLGTAPSAACVITVLARPFDLGGRPALVLVPQGGRAPRHLVLAAPSKHLADTYSAALQGALRCAALLAEGGAREGGGVGERLRAVGRREGSEVLEQLGRSQVWGEGGEEPPAVEERVVGSVLATLQSLARVERMVPCRRRGGRGRGEE